MKQCCDGFNTTVGEETEKATAALLRRSRITLQEAMFMSALITAKSDLTLGASQVESHVKTTLARPNEIRVKAGDIFPTLWGAALRVQQGNAP